MLYVYLIFVIFITVFFYSCGYKFEFGGDLNVDVTNSFFTAIGTVVSASLLMVTVHTLLSQEKNNRILYLETFIHTWREDLRNLSYEYNGKKYKGVDVLKGVIEEYKRDECYQEEYELKDMFSDSLEGSIVKNYLLCLTEIWDYIEKTNNREQQFYKHYIRTLLTIHEKEIIKRSAQTDDKIKCIYEFILSDENINKSFVHKIK